MADSTQAIFFAVPDGKDYYWPTQITKLIKHETGLQLQSRTAFSETGFNFFIADGSCQLSGRGADFYD